MIERRVWKINRPGDLGRLRPASEPLGDPKRDEVLVGIRAIGLNFADIFACLGLYSATPGGPFVPGLEFAGEVRAAGADVSEFQPGDRVMGLTRFGAYASCLNSNPRYLAPIPDGWSFEEGAAFLVQTATAWYAIEKLGRQRRNPVVLLHSAAGGVGLRALAILAGIGATVVGTVGSASKVDFLVQNSLLTENRILVRDRSRFGDQLDGVLSDLGVPGFDLILDSVAGPYFSPAYRRLRPTGRLVIYGAADFMPEAQRPNRLKLFYRYLRRPRLDPLQMIADNRSVLGFNLIWLWSELELLAEGMTALETYYTYPPRIGQAFGFDAVPQAMRHLQSGASVGKIVVKV